MDTKIFCIGFHKTGTTSLATALKVLGYNVTGPNGVTDPHIAFNVHSMAEALVKQYEAFQDNPWPVIFKEIDTKYPKSKFILTLRDSETWIDSQVKHFGINETPMRKWIYGSGCPKGNEEIYVKRFEEHNKEVKQYFKNRPTDLLLLELAKGDGWEKLCPFLGKSIPNESFPHANTASDRKKRKQPISRFVKKSQRLKEQIKKYFI